MEGEKTQGRDGFQRILHKRCWGLLKGDLMKVLRGSQNSTFINWRLNNTFISLVPKKDGESQLETLDRLLFFLEHIEYYLNPQPIG